MGIKENSVIAVTCFDIDLWSIFETLVFN